MPQQPWFMQQPIDGGALPARQNSPAQEQLSAGLGRQELAQEPRNAEIEGYRQELLKAIAELDAFTNPNNPSQTPDNSPAQQQLKNALIQQQEGQQPQAADAMSYVPASEFALRKDSEPNAYDVLGNPENTTAMLTNFFRKQYEETQLNKQVDPRQRSGDVLDYPDGNYRKTY